MRQSRTLKNCRDRRSHWLRRGERGQGLVEYALGITLVGMVATVSLALLGPGINDAYCDAIQTLNPDLASGCSGITILFAKYNAAKTELDIQAKAPKDCSEDLIVKDLGPMIRQGESYVFKYTGSLTPPPTTVEVGHPDCGWNSTPIS